MFVLKNERILKQMLTTKGQSLSQLSTQQPVMLIFLRHLGCMFCKETLSELKKIKHKIDDLGIKIVFVHMAEEEVASSFLKNYQFDDDAHICDPDAFYYSEFGLAQGDFKQLFGFSSFLGMGRAAVKGNMPSKKIGDPQQMPGIFMVKDDKIIKSFIYKSVADYPDYVAIATL